MTTTSKAYRLTSQFHVTSWNEQPYDEGAGLPKLTRATVAVDYTGDVEGKGVIQYLMAYRDDGTADFVGVQRISGTVNGRQGSFVLRTTGTFDGKQARGDDTVVEGSGTGALSGITGRGEFAAERGPDGRATLHVDLA